MPPDKKNRFPRPQQEVDRLVRRLHAPKAFKPAQTYCVFMDILGFKLLLDDWDEARRAFSDAMASMLVLPMLHDMLAKPLGKISKRPLLAPVEVLALSDAVILTSVGLRDLLWLCSAAIGLCLSKHIALRGYLTRGVHAELRQGRHRLVLSRALRDAYEGERARAVFPRLILDQQVVQGLTSTRPHSADDIPGLSQDEDGQWFVAPFSYVGYMHELEDAMAFVTAALDKFAARSDLLAKYCWLADLLNAIAFGRQPSYYGRSDLRRTLRHMQSTPTDTELRPIPVWNYSECASTNWQVVVGASPAQEKE